MHFLTAGNRMREIGESTRVLIQVGMLFVGLDRQHVHQDD
jgi:hypothetical protein